ncbi:MAG: hypothetical protein PHC97_00075 [Patescibacteria group bacterium]|nr:hypothetical protein [Patescibacteria group bacterium]
MGENDSLHIDEGVSGALLELNEGIKKFSGKSGNEYAVLFIPHAADERIVMSVNGVFGQ